jgi:arylformamidase
MIIDLSVPINEDTPVYPGDPATKIEPAGTLAADGYNDHYVSFGTHVGTHIDAPLHMLEGGISLDKAPIESYVGKGKLVTVTAGNFDGVLNVGLSNNDIVLFFTGMGDKFHESEYFEDYPAMSEATAKYLVDSKVKMVGVDTCSIDNQDGFPIHKILLAGGVLIVENLTNLEKLVGKDFEVCALPMKLQLDGAPARVIAQVNEILG